MTTSEKLFEALKTFNLNYNDALRKAMVSKVLIEQTLIEIEKNKQEKGEKHETTI